MRYWVSLPVAVLTALFVLTGSTAAGQTRKSKAKKRHARQMTVVQGTIPAPAEIPAVAPTPPPIPATQTPEDGVRRITPVEAREAFDKGKAIIIDVRGEDSFKAGHIKGARWIQLNDIESRIKEFPRDKMIITYCS